MCTCVCSLYVCACVFIVRVCVHVCMRMCKCVNVCVCMCVHVLKHHPYPNSTHITRDIHSKLQPSFPSTSNTGVDTTRPAYSSRRRLLLLVFQEQKMGCKQISECWIRKTFRGCITRVPPLPSPVKYRVICCNTCCA